MSAVYNYAPGPAMLPPAVLEEVRRDLAERRPVSVLEAGHRTDWFDEIAARSQANLRRLLDVSDDYAVLFLPGGARAQYAAVPLNLGAEDADYFNTGHWSGWAMDEAARYTRVHVAAEIAEQDGLLTLPPPSQWANSRRPAYRHYVGNETLTGFAFAADRHLDDGLLVADLTSNFLTAPVDVSRHRVIYAGAQKNAGIAGLAVVIVARETFGAARAETPAICNYELQDKTDSRFNTPPVFSWYVCDRVLEWTRREGGVPEMQRRAARRAATLYDCIDASGLYDNPVAPPSRSSTNIFFRLRPPQLESRFLREAGEQGLLGLRGHRATGGIRASLYNGMPPEGAAALAEFMCDFEKRA
ncbi:MAG: 3-phosphoserine/phosphohydroxythreonine transaminase [Gammaproteobacteria bacterium]|nr:3-phosphoserine/phosphohydroxythreonine transaminase [Gammaproteobacteria bacterium]